MQYLKFTFNDPIIEELEKLTIQVQGRQNLLTFMINNNMFPSHNFDLYQEEYLNYYMQYERKKREFQKKYIDSILEERQINPTAASWNIDFATGVTTLSYEI